MSHPDERVRTLFVSTGGGIDYPGECRGIERAVQGGRARDGWEEPAHHAFVSRQELADKARRVRPQIFHLSAHGGLDESSGVPSILLAKNERRIEFGEDDFVEMVALQRENLRVLYLNRDLLREDGTVHRDFGETPRQGRLLRFAVTQVRFMVLGGGAPISESLTHGIEIIGLS